MKTYKDFEKQYIGSSDIARLTLIGAEKVQFLEFNEDASYYAYIIEGDCKIGEHYKNVAEFKDWLKIVDDEEIVRTFEGRKIIVYRAGMRGCIIQIIE